MVDTGRMYTNWDSTQGKDNKTDQEAVKNITSSSFPDSTDAQTESVVPPDPIPTTFWPTYDTEGFYDVNDISDKTHESGGDLQAFLSDEFPVNQGDQLSTEYLPNISKSAFTTEQSTDLLLGNENPTLCSINSSTASAPLLDNHLNGYPSNYSAYESFGNYGNTQTASFGGLLADAVHATIGPQATFVGDEYDTWAPIETSDISSSSESDPDDLTYSSPSTDSANAALPTVVSNSEGAKGHGLAGKSPEEILAIKQRMKDQIRIRREFEGKGEIPASELFETPKSYPLTKEEIERNETRKARNRKSANKSRIKRIQREQTLAMNADQAEELNSQLAREVRELKNMKRLLLMKLEMHEKSGCCKKRRLCGSNNILEATPGSNNVTPSQVTSTLVTCSSGVMTSSFNLQTSASVPSASQNGTVTISGMTLSSGNLNPVTVTPRANTPQYYTSQIERHCNAKLDKEEEIKRIKDNLLADFRAPMPDAETN